MYNFNNNQSSNTTYVFDINKDEIKQLSNNLNIENIASLKDFKTFYKIPFQLYKENTFWVPHFWKELNEFFKKKNPFWSHSDCKLFIAKKNGKPVGRIAAIIDYKFCEKVNKKIGYFGFFECINDFNCAKALFQSAQKWLVSENVDIMRGPIDGRIDVSCGFLANCFDSSPSSLSTYTPDYYILFAEKFNMKKSREFISYYIDLTKPILNKLKKKSQQCINSGIKIRTFNRFRTKKELKWWINLFLETFVDHWGYVPVSTDEVKSRFGIKQLKWLADPKLFLIAEYKDLPVGYLLSTPDYNQIFKKMNGRLGASQLIKFLFMQKRINRGKMHFIGIKKELRNKNIGSCLNYKALVEMKKRGYIGAEVGVIDEKNAIAHATIAKTGAKPYKRYRVYEKNI